MMYTNQDLLDLEGLDNEELAEKLEQATEYYDYVQSLYQGEEEDKSKEKINLQVIFMHLTNIENYIRRIENLINEYEIDRSFIRQAVQRRKSRLKRRGITRL